VSPSSVVVVVVFVVTGEAHARPAKLRGLARRGARRQIYYFAWPANIIIIESRRLRRFVRITAINIIGRRRVFVRYYRRRSTERGRPGDSTMFIHPSGGVVVHRCFSVFLLA